MVEPRGNGNMGGLYLDHVVVIEYKDEIAGKEVNLTRMPAL
jgi:hypothetical protein